MDTLVLVLAAVALVAVGLPLLFVIRMGNRMRAKLMAEPPLVPEEPVGQGPVPHLTDAEWADLLRYQRHAWLNHLQVVSGWLQMQQPTKAEAYLAKTLAHIDGWGQVLRRATPALIGLIFGLQPMADRHGVDVAVDLPDGIWLPDVAMEQAAAMRQLLQQLVEQLGAVPGEKMLVVHLGTTDDGTGLRLRCTANVPLPQIASGLVPGDRRVEVVASPEAWQLAVLPAPAPQAMDGTGAGEAGRTAQGA